MCILVFFNVQYYILVMCHKISYHISQLGCGVKQHCNNVVNSKVKIPHNFVQTLDMHSGQNIHFQQK